MATPFAISLGSDFRCVDDLDAALTLEVDGRVVAAQAAARRLTTPRRHLWYDLDYGDDLSQQIGKITSPFQLQQRAEREVLKDERVFTARSKATLLEATDPGVADADIGRFTLEVELGYDDGTTFDLTLNVAGGGVTAEIIGGD